MTWLGPAISAGAQLIGGFLGSSAAKDANAQNAAIAARNADNQIDFAQRGIRWKVEDAKKAGIHPIYALGAPTNSYSPVSFSATADNSMAAAVSGMGQDINRAIQATRTSGERIDAYTQAVQRLTLEKGSLENQLLASQIKRLETQTNPPMPSIGSGAFVVPEKSKPEERQPLMLDGNRIATDPGTSPGNAFEDQLGDDIFSPGFLPNLYGMLRARYGPYQNWPKQILESAISDFSVGMHNPHFSARRVTGGPRRGQSFYDYLFERR